MNDADLEQQVRAALYATLHRLTGVDAPESDYPRLEPLAGDVAYLRGKGV